MYPKVFSPFGTSPRGTVLAVNRARPEKCDMPAYLNVVYIDRVNMAFQDLESRRPVQT